MQTTDIPADVLEQLATEEEFAAAADQAVEITGQTLGIRKAELAEAQQAYERAEDSLAAATRAAKLAREKVTGLLKGNGIVRTADGYRRADPCPACGYPVSAGRHMRAIDALNCDWGN